MEPLGAMVDAWLNRNRARGMAETTIGVYRASLNRFLAWLVLQEIDDPTAITRDLVERFFHEAADGEDPLRPASLHHLRSVLRGFLGDLVERRVLLRNEAKSFRLAPLVPSFRRPPSRKNLRKLLEAPGSDPIGLRDRALFETLYNTGIRRAECCALDLGDCDRLEGFLRIRRGKGGRGRVVPIGKTALSALAAYLVRSRPRLGARDSALFVSAKGARLHVRSITEVFRRWNRKLGLDPPITPHLLRHACATHLLEEGADIRSVQEILGHTNIDTTQIYTHVDVKRLKEKLDRIDPRRRLEGP